MEIKTSKFFLKDGTEVDVIVPRGEARLGALMRFRRMFKLNPNLRVYLAGEIPIPISRLSLYEILIRTKTGKIVRVETREDETPRQAWNRILNTIRIATEGKKQNGALLPTLNGDQIYVHDISLNKIDFEEINGISPEIKFGSRKKKAKNMVSNGQWLNLSSGRYEDAE